MIKRNQPFEYRVGDALFFGVTKVPDGVQFAIYKPNCKSCFLKLYKKGQKSPASVVELTDTYKIGSAYFVIVSKSAQNKDTRTIWEILSQDYEYIYEVDGVEMIDPYADYVTGRKNWGKRISDKTERGGIVMDSFSWEDDVPLHTPYADMILYQLHVRGYTKHASSKVKDKGTFRGLMEKIPYLKDLGINAVLLLPVYEFCEIQEQVSENKTAADNQEEPAAEPKLNYWGYGTKDTYYFAPKAAYSSGKVSPSREFCELVKAMHQAGIEVLLDIYFVPGTNLFLMTDCLRSWVIKYHVDGFRVNQEVMPSLTVASDPILSGVKILGNYWDMEALHQAKISGQKDALAEYNEGYMNIARQFLKSDEGMVQKAAQAFLRNSKEHSYINFVTHVNGFTLMDLVSYDIKHNEPNGEMNRDGTEFNYSWNCGIEGKTRKKAILDRRLTQIRNALLMLFASQGTPMLLAGDEFGQTQAGNNNAYCQDNPTAWIHWNSTKISESIHAYVKHLIQMRKCFKVLHQDELLYQMDRLSCGMPDVSIHGQQAWRPDFTNYSRMLGMLYYGDYVDKIKGRSVYIIYNMYWEQKSFDLPDLPKGRKWKLLLDTYDNTFDESMLYPERKKLPKSRKKTVAKGIQRKTIVAPRSAVIFVEE